MEKHLDIFISEGNMHGWLDVCRGFYSSYIDFIFLILSQDYALTSAVSTDSLLSV